jgi:uncharacterized protein YkwD
MLVKKIYWGLLCLFLVLLLEACSSGVTPQSLSSHTITSNSLSSGDFQQTPTPTPMPPLSIPSQKATPTPAQHSATPAAQKSPSGCVTYSQETTQAPARNGGLAAPYGPAPTSGEAQQLANQLFQLINSDRAACGLPAFAWNSTLASGARLHSWNMAHCGFSHTCPDGSTPYQRIANEGFAGASDCGENIGEAGPYPTPWGGTYNIQESMAHEPLGGWHRIHLFSTTLHRVGVGVYVDSGGSIWFTEDMAS